MADEAPPALRRATISALIFVHIRLFALIEASAALVSGAGGASEADCYGRYEITFICFFLAHRAPSLLEFVSLFTVISCDDIVVSVLSCSPPHDLCLIPWPHAPSPPSKPSWPQALSPPRKATSQLPPPPHSSHLRHRHLRRIHSISVACRIDKRMLCSPPASRALAPAPPPPYHRPLPRRR